MNAAYDCTARTPPRAPAPLPDPVTVTTATTAWPLRAALAVLAWVLANLAALLVCLPAIAQTADARQDPRISLALPRQAAAAADVFAATMAQRQDSAGRPFAVVDKSTARLRLYTADGQPAGETAVLLGSARGDASAAGVGLRTQQQRLSARDRTTPAGRFVAEVGPNHSGETVVWVDPQAAFAIHRLRAGAGAAERRRRLAAVAAGDAAQARVSAGCVVVPVAFFEHRVLPLMQRGGAVVYVLPEDAQS